MLSLCLPLSVLFSVRHFLLSDEETEAQKVSVACTGTQSSV